MYRLGLLGDLSDDWRVATIGGTVRPSYSKAI